MSQGPTRIDEIVLNDTKEYSAECVEVWSAVYGSVAPVQVMVGLEDDAAALLAVVGLGDEQAFEAWWAAASTGVCDRVGSVKVVKFYTCELH